MSNGWEGDDRRAPERWHFKKDISLVDILTIVFAAAAIVSAWATLDKRVSLLEQVAAQINSDQKRQDDERAYIRREIKEELEKLNNKIDRFFLRNTKETR
jgi:hypothetical protein